MKWNLEPRLSRKSITQPNHFKLRRAFRWVANRSDYLRVKNEALKTVF